MGKTNISYRYDYYDFHIDHMTIHWDEAILRVAPPHIHNRAELLLVERGSSTVITNDSIFHAKGRYLVYIPPQCIHEQINEYSNDYYSRYCLSIAPSDIGLGEYIFPELPFMLELDRTQFTSIHIIIDALYKFHELRTEPPSETDLHRRRNLLRMLQNELKPLLLTQSSGTRAASHESKNDYIERICLTVNERYPEKLSLDTLAADYFISRSKLTRDFRAKMNMSIGDYITAVRINKSIPRLLDRMPISEIARSCGFSSASHYIRCFCKWSDQTPAKYRESHRRMPDEDELVE